jgi:hypothetical protein
MINKKIPVTTYLDGERKVVGEAIVTQVGNALHGRMVITDEETQGLLRVTGEFSLGDFTVPESL